MFDQWDPANPVPQRPGSVDGSGGDLLYRQGRVDGSRWAIAYATARELAHITGRFRLRHAGVFRSTHSIVRFMSDRAGEDLVVIGYSDRGDCGRYWQGFIDGARHKRARGHTPKIRSGDLRRVMR